MTHFFAFFFPLFPAGLCLRFKSPKDTSFADKGTTEKMRRDYLPVCKRKAPQLQAWWCRGHRPRVAQLLRYALETGRVTSCSSSGLSWSTAAQSSAAAACVAVGFVSHFCYLPQLCSLLPCTSLSRWSVALVLWKKEWVLWFTGLLEADGSCCLCTPMKWLLASC